jgi:hypothetical protein
VHKGQAGERSIEFQRRESTQPNQSFSVADQETNQLSAGLKLEPIQALQGRDVVSGC